jgi:hypothetical protein
MLFVEVHQIECDERQGATTFSGSPRAGPRSRCGPFCPVAITSPLIVVESTGSSPVPATIAGYFAVPVEGAAGERPSFAVLDQQLGPVS